MIALSPAASLLTHKRGMSGQVAVVALEEYRRALDAWLESARLSGYERYYDYYAVALGYWGVGDRVKAAAFYNTAAEQDEAFAEWKTLVTRTESWSWAEKTAMYGLYDAWRLGYRVKEEKKP